MSRSRSRSPSPVAARRRSNSRSASPAPREDRQRGREGEAADGTKLFIGNIGFDTTERELEDLCDKYGKVVECRLAMDRSTNRPKGFAFVTMDTAEDADKCVEGLAGKEIDGRAVTVQISHGKGGRRREGDSSALDDARATGACFDFVKGQCSRGDSCRFKHIGSGGGGGRDRDRGYDRRDRYDDRRGGRDRSRSRSPRRDYGRDRDHGRDRDYDRRDRDYDRRDRDHGRDRGSSRDYDRRDRSRSRDRDHRR